MFLGIDIGGTKCSVVKSDINGSIIDKINFKTTDKENTLSNIINAAKKLKDNCITCGISCGGPLDENKGIIMSPPNLPGWDNVAITEIIESKIGIKTKIRNDANACAMAEYYFGAGKGYENIVFLTFGTGLGAGIILNGRLYSGTNGNAGEVGHIRLADNGPVGYNKAGSFEGFCSGGGIKRLADIILSKETAKPDWANSQYSAKEIADAARNGDAVASRIYNICGEKLGYGLSIIIDILNPQLIIIGSVFARCEDLLRPPMEKIINTEALQISREVCKIVPPMLSEGIGDVAAIAVAKELYDEIY